MASIFDRIRTIDTDTHVTEPPDVWTARVSKKWGDAVPHVRRVDGRDVWFIRDQTAGAPGFTTQAGFEGSYPEARKTYEEIPRSSYDARARLEHMDAEKIWAQVLYPNVGGFGSGGFLRLREPELMLECVRAYNDFLVEWCSADLRRLIPVAAMPFWDVKAAVADGRLPPERLANYLRLRKEVTSKPVEEADIKAAAERRRESRIAAKALKRLYAERHK